MPTTDDRLNHDSGHRRADGGEAWRGRRRGEREKREKERGGRGRERERERETYRSHIT